MGKLVATRPNLARLLASANTMARAEILVGLREPHCQLVRLLKARSEDMREMEDLEVLVEDVSAPQWGTW